MKIFTGDIQAYAVAGLWTGDVPFVTYYADNHVQYGTGNATNTKPMNLALHCELVTEDYLSTGGQNAVGGNNSPLTIISPEYAPYPFAGNCVIAYITTNAGGLSVADEELEDDYEYINVYTTPAGTLVGYLVWGTFKVTKTDFYTPTLMGAVTTCRSWNPIEGVEHSSLDYSEKIAQVIES